MDFDERMCLFDLQRQRQCMPTKFHFKRGVDKRPNRIIQLKKFNYYELKYWRSQIFCDKFLLLIGHTLWDKENTSKTNVNLCP